jgi:hypothetical protein
MTEKQWLSYTDSRAMLAFLRGDKRASDRKLRLFTAACCRSVWRHLPDECCRQAVEVGEQFADGFTGDEKRDAAWTAIRILKERAVAEQDFERAAALLDSEGPVYDNMKRERFHTPLESHGKRVFLRDIFGNPFRAKPGIAKAVLQWNNGTVLLLAEAAYKERTLPSGHLDPARLAVLADALEEAGCVDQEVLAHLREPGGVHVRGCWPVDLLLGRS